MPKGPWNEVDTDSNEAVEPQDSFPKVAYMHSAHMVAVPFFLASAIAVELLGGLSVITGFKSRWVSRKQEIKFIGLMGESGSPVGPYSISRQFLYDYIFGTKDASFQ
jgi:hypothetical protein